VWFSMSPEDAHALVRHVAPEVSEHDLAHLGAYTAVARLVVGGEEAPAFTLRTRPAPSAVAGAAEAVRAANQARAARPTHRPPTLAGRALPATSRPGPGGAGDVRNGLREGLHGGLRPGTEPPGPAIPARQGDEEGSAGSADSFGKWS